MCTDAYTRVCGVSVKCVLCASKLYHDKKNYGKNLFDREQILYGTSSMGINIIETIANHQKRNCTVAKKSLILRTSFDCRNVKHMEKNLEIG